MNWNNNRVYLTQKSETKSYLFMFAILVISSVYTTFISENTTVAVFLCLIPIILLFAQTANKLSPNVFLAIWIVWNVINFLHVFGGVNTYFLRVIVFQNIVIIMIYLASLYRCSESQFERTRVVADIVTVILCIAEIILSVSNSEKGFSFVLFGLFYFLLCDKQKSKYLKIALMMVAFWLKGSRSSILMVLICLLIYWWIKRIRQSKKMYRLTFFITAFVTVLIPYGYIWLYRSPYRSSLNDLSRLIFGKNFFSGRNLIWIQISEWLEQNNILFGIGSDFVGGNYSQQLGMSTHNINLFLLGQGGILLLLLFFILLYKLYMRFYLCIENMYILSASCFLLGLMIRGSFDLILVANQFVPSMYAWLSVCIALSYCNALQKKFLQSNKTLGVIK